MCNSILGARHCKFGWLNVVLGNVLSHLCLSYFVVCLGCNNIATKYVLMSKLYILSFPLHLYLSYIHTCKLHIVSISSLSV